MRYNWVSTHEIEKYLGYSWLSKVPILRSMLGAILDYLDHSMKHQVWNPELQFWEETKSSKCEKKSGQSFQPKVCVG